MQGTPYWFARRDAIITPFCVTSFFHHGRQELRALASPPIQSPHGSMEWSFRIWERMFRWTVLDPKRNPKVDAESIPGEQVTISPRGRVDRNLASVFAVLSMGARTRMIQQYQRSQSTITTGCPCEGGAAGGGECAKGSSRSNQVSCSRRRRAHTTCP